MNEKSKKARGGRNYTLVEVAKLMNDGGRPMSIAALRAACKEFELKSSKVRGVTVVSHGDFLDFLNARSVVPETNRSSPVAPENLALAKSALDGLRGRIQDEKTRREDGSISDNKDSSAGNPGDSLEPRTVGKADDSPMLDDESIHSGRLQPEVESPVSIPTEETQTHRDEDCEVEEAIIPSASDLEASTRPPAASELSLDTVEAKIVGFDDTKDHLRPASGGGSIEVPSPEGLGHDEKLMVLEETKKLLVEEDVLGADMHMRCELEELETGEFRRHGTYQSWYLNEQQAALGHYERGKLEGAWLQWHKNGRLQSEGRYAAGLQDGSWTSWDEQGGKLQVGNFVDGEADGAWYEFHGNGAIWRECHFKRGEVVGTQTYYGVDGAPLDDSDGI